MASMILLAGHPYFEIEKPSVWQMPWNGKWTVRWRDFYTVKQDLDFDTEAKARAFAETICKPPLVIDEDDCGGFELAELDRFWRELWIGARP